MVIRTEVKDRILVIVGLGFLALLGLARLDSMWARVSLLCAFGLKRDSILLLPEAVIFRVVMEVGEDG